jgi:hypothetical protein
MISNTLSHRKLTDYDSEDSEAAKAKADGKDEADALDDPNSERNFRYVV